MNAQKISGDCLIIRMPSYQYREPHDKNKTISQLSYLIMGISIPGKTIFILRQGLKVDDGII